MTGETFEVRNPADADDLVGRFQRSGREDADAAVEAAAAAQSSWGEIPGPERGRALKRTARRLEDRKAELAETLTREEGATLETGGGRPDDPSLDSGYFVEPTVFSGVDPDMRIAREEVFGPVLAVVPAADLDEAIRVANGVDYGLSASVVTNDLTEANRFVDEIEAGVAKVNEKTTGLELHVPFGGVKASSSETYREQGEAALDFYTISKTVYSNY